MVVFSEVFFGDGDGIVETAVLCGILHFFGEDVAAVDNAGDVGNKDAACGLGFADFIFAEVDVFDAFLGKFGGRTN